MQFADYVGRASGLARAFVLGAVFLLMPLVHQARAADADGFDLTLHPIGAAWYEENWLVKDGKLTEFLNAYRKEIYALARRTPGYRGYFVWTTMPVEPGEPPAPAKPPNPEGFSAKNDTFISKHPSIYLNGTVRTERSVKIGMLMGKTYNVKISHSLQSWENAANFQAAMNKLYADEHGGEVLAEHLSKTVYPLVDNVWTAFFRTIEAGYAAPAYPGVGAAKAGDADGLNLEPRRGPVNITEEGWDIKPGQLDAFLKAYDRDVFSANRKVKGYRGYIVMTTLPPKANEPKPLVRLGSPDTFTVPYPGLLMTGDVRTNLSINAGMLFQKVYNAKIYHLIDTWEDAAAWLSEYKRIYMEDHKGQDPWPALEKTLFPLVNNHWDFGYRTVETSFTPK